LSYWNGARYFKVAGTEASDELEIGILLRPTIKMTFRHFTPPGAPQRHLRTAKPDF
jgi:hypothetical protein